MAVVNGKIALMHVKTKSAYTFPGGGIELGESIEEGMRRELYEVKARDTTILEYLVNSNTESAQMFKNLTEQCKPLG